MEATKSGIIEALAKAQAEFAVVEKNCVNVFTGVRYADLSSIITATRPALTRHGLVVTQAAATSVQPDGLRGSVTVTTTLAHVSGGELVDHCTLPVLPLAAKGEKVGTGPVVPASFGAAITYARRFGLSSLLCVAAEDVDAEQTQAREQAKQERQAKAQPKTKTDVDRAAGLPTAELEASLERTQKHLAEAPDDARAKGWLEVLQAEKQRRFNQATTKS